MIRAVTLDAAGTLIATAEPVGATYARVAGRHGIRVAAAAAERGFRAAVAAAPPLAFPGAAPGRLREHERAWWLAVVRRALGETAPGPALAATFEALWVHYAAAGAWRVFPEAPAALAALRRRGLRLAVVSNFDTRLPPLLDALGLGARVDAVVHSTAAGSAKPDAAIFRLALDRLGVAAGETLHAGDEAVADVRGALDAGLRAALVARSGRPPAVPAAVRVVDALDALPGLVDAA